MNKQLYILLVCCMARLTIHAQDYTTEIVTKQVHAGLVKEVSVTAKAFEDSLRNNDLGSSDISISYEVAKYKIEKLLEKRMNIDYSTNGMNTTMYEAADSYDKLMNVYYNAAMKLLAEADKKVFVTAQKSWIMFRDNEIKLVATLSSDKNSSGGTMQTNIAASRYLDMIKTRCTTINYYYSGLLKASM